MVIQEGLVKKRDEATTGLNPLALKWNATSETTLDTWKMIVE